MYWWTYKPNQQKCYPIEDPLDPLQRRPCIFSTGNLETLLLPLQTLELLLFVIQMKNLCDFDIIASSTHSTEDMLQRLALPPRRVLSLILSI
jgi:hypothetical protein